MKIYKEIHLEEIYSFVLHKLIDVRVLTGANGRIGHRILNNRHYGKYF